MISSPGVATSILSLCVVGSNWLSASGRAQGLNITLATELEEPGYDDDFDHSEGELAALRRSWALTKAVLERLQGPCRVTLRKRSLC